MRSTILALLALAALLMAGCDWERNSTYIHCVDRCGPGPDCSTSCAAATAKIYGLDKENEHVFRLEHGKK